MDKLEEEELQVLQTATVDRKEQLDDRRFPKLKKVRRKTTTRRMIISTAAAAILLMAGFFAYFSNSSQMDEAKEVARKQLVAEKGERASYTLSDGTKLILHAGSRLEIPLSYNVEKRELFLHGEAYFEVSHNAAKPFIVHSGSVYTRVLGTKFLVQAWPDKDGDVEVIVREGTVALGDNRSGDSIDNNEAIINRNQKGVFAENRKPEVVSQIDMEWHMGWTTGRLVFDDRPFREIIPRLERWYSLNIKIENERIAEKRLTAEIDYSQPMGEVLEGIALSLELKLEENGRTIFFKEQDH